MLSDLKYEIEKTKQKLKGLIDGIGIEKLVENRKQLESASSVSNFWDNPSSAQKVLQELKQVNDQISVAETLRKETDDIETIIELSLGEEDPNTEAQIRKDLDLLISKIEKLSISTLLNGEHDGANAILSINAGAGGTDAQDWAQILMRMYSRWAEARGFEAEIADVSYGEQAGIKSAVLIIKGLYAYGFLRSENGIHRLVRMSPFNSDGKRHTSFAAVEVIPESGEELFVEIKTEDLRIDTFRSSGPGGQNVNKTSSAVRLTHLPTGIVAQSQSSPSQHRNKEIAMRLLAARIKDRLDKEKKEKLDELKGEQKQIAWGSQIRSYVFAPYQLVKDHRTNFEFGNVEKVIDGDIDPFIEAYLKNQPKK